MAKTANILGVGLIGASIGFDLKASGWTVNGSDKLEENLKAALKTGAIDSVGWNESADISFVAVPVSELNSAISKALEKTSGIVTDVGSVKAPVIENISNERFVGGHPMAGNELEGTSGARAGLFEGAVWILTPSAETADSTYTEVREAVKSMGAEVISLPANEHDSLVAVISHIPHLTAGALMRMAVDQSQEHRVLMRLAAGGFRDMTRIASGSPEIWLDICESNKQAICSHLDSFIQELKEMKGIIERGDRPQLLEELSAARNARRSLPVGVSRPEDLAEVRVVILDRSGSADEITTLASQLNINIYDLEIAHSIEGGSGTMILIVESADEKILCEKLRTNGYSPSSRRLE